MSCKTFNRSVDSCNKVLLSRYRSIMHHTFHTTPQKICERFQKWRPCWPRNWSPFTNPSIWIRNIEVIPHISLKVLRWLKGWITAVLGHQKRTRTNCDTRSFSNFDALHNPNRAFPDRGFFLNNNPFAVLHNVLTVEGVFGTHCISVQACDNFSTYLPPREITNDTNSLLLAYHVMCYVFASLIFLWHPNWDILLKRVRFLIAYP